MLTYVGTRHTCRRLSLNETATACQADRVAFCKQTDFNGGPYRPLHDGGVGAGSQPTVCVESYPVIRECASMLLTNMTVQRNPVAAIPETTHNGLK